MGVVILLLIGFVTAAYFFLRNQLNYWSKRGVPCDPPSLIIGNLDGVGKTIHFTTNIQVIYEKFKIGNKFCGFYLLQSPRVLVIDLELIKNIIIKDFSNFADRGIFHTDIDPLSNHLFALEGKFPISY